MFSAEELWEDQLVRQGHLTRRMTSRRQPPSGRSRSTEPVQPPPQVKLKILALHGFRTSAKILQSQVALSGGLKRILDEEAEVSYVEAPHPASGPAYPEVESFFPGLPYFEWWHATKVTTGEVGSGVKDGTPMSEKMELMPEWTYSGVEEGLDHLEKYLEAHGPFDGLMGFSQGASVCALMVMLQREGLRFQKFPRFNFAILIAGGKYMFEAYSPVYARACEAPSTRPLLSSASAVIGEEEDPGGPVPLSWCHTCMMIGDDDPLKGWSEELCACFEAPLLLRHPQGHVVPKLSLFQLSALSEWFEEVRTVEEQKALLSQQKKEAAVGVEYSRLPSKRGGIDYLRMPSTRLAVTREAQLEAEVSALKRKVHELEMALALALAGKSPLS